MLQDAHSLNLPSLPMYVRFFQFLRVGLVAFPVISNSVTSQHIVAYLECENVVGEHNHFIPPVLVVLDKELTRLELSWVHAVKQHAFT
jgi:hypothetical protein